MLLLGLLLAVPTLLEVQAAARAHFAAGDYRASAAEWRQALALKPGDAASVLGLAVAEDARGHYAEARRWFATALQANGQVPQVLTNAAVNLTHLGNTEEAIELLRRSLALDSGNATAAFNLGRLYLEVGRAEEALPLLAQVAAKVPNDAGVLQNLARAHRAMAEQRFRRGDLAGSLPEFQQAIDGNPDDARAYAGLTLALLSGGAQDGAAETLKVAEERFPENPRFALLAGYQASLNGDWTTAGDEYRRALRLNARLVVARVLLGHAEREGGDVQPSIVTLRRAVSEAPGSALARYELAESLLAADSRSAEAVRQLRTAMEQDGKRPEPAYALAKLALARSDLAGAERYAKAAVRADPQLPEPHYVLGQIYRRQNQLDLAGREMAEHARLKQRPPLALIRDLAEEPHP